MDDGYTSCSSKSRYAQYWQVHVYGNGTAVSSEHFETAFRDNSQYRSS